MGEAALPKGAALFISTTAATSAIILDWEACRMAKGEGRDKVVSVHSRYPSLTLHKKYCKLNYIEMKLQTYAGTFCAIL